MDERTPHLSDPNVLCCAKNTIFFKIFTNMRIFLYLSLLLSSLAFTPSSSSNKTFIHKINANVKLRLCPEQAQQLVAASCSEHAYTHDPHHNHSNSSLEDSTSSNSRTSSAVAATAEETLLESQEEEKSQAFLTRIMSASPNLIPHLWENWTSSKHDEYISPIVGFRWVKSKADGDLSETMVVLPSCSAGTKCCVPNKDEELVGWFNEVCILKEKNG